MYKLEKQQENPDYAGKLKKPFDFKILFVIVIVLMVAALGWVLVKNIGKIDAIGEEADSQ